ncbi:MULTISPECIES: tail fiber domain-containing protein [unclassified Pseudomonas]|uniref:tail fiber domain-containing protein n=1 Tax=unclassified Pseudomonas TaxID=196821 RepID=UPI0011998044|nr:MULTISPECIES: tail fiber domain-containing protein [unclassified Pseudomonas]TWC06661.1 endosialidase-like protein [Pseudomonas sp. SJZ075]TWC26643.1 endosialidase-like protein [Pseudomonas sp. SJZ078]TWC44050.1 endosialidase-like protein [Pseudomonas sp. SJZ080]TWC45351.1 endosialidase-like protein [Pseudomonas sp. SJZ124]TWC80431.1 endosialidase-like protein [Pseudomonas sp. SJZ101]
MAGIKGFVFSGALLLASFGSVASAEAGGIGNRCCPFSDERLKQNIQPLQGATEKLLELHGVSYEFKRDGKKDVGLLAQDVEKVYPELVVEKEGYKQLDYEKLTAPLIEAVRELNGRIANLEAKTAAKHTH